MAKTHQGIRSPDGQFIKDTPGNRKDKDNTIERVPNPGYGDTDR